MPKSTLTSKGQITVPQEVRESLHLKAGSKIEFIIEPGGRVIFQPLRSDFKVLKGMLKSKLKRPASVEEMNEAIARGYSGT
jgi:antitoxin PrlF